MHIYYMPGNWDFKNEQLAYELLIDPNFKINQDKTNKFVNTLIRKKFKRALWDILVEELTRDPPSFASLLDVLCEIKQGIVSMSRNLPESHRIEEIIDIKHIEIELKENVFNHLSYERFIDNTIGVIVDIHKHMKATESCEVSGFPWISL